VGPGGPDRDPAQVDQVVRGVDIIIHAAATTSGARDIVQRPQIHVTDNAVMSSLLLRAAHEHGVGRFLFFSCTVMYPSQDAPLRETDFDASAELHHRYFGVGWTKIYIEKMCEFYSRLGATRHTVLRHSNIYGPHDKYDLERSHVFGATVTKVMQASDGRVVVWGTGEEARDLLHVSDLVRCVRLALDNQSTLFGLYNVGAGHAVTIRDLVTAIIHGAGRSLQIEHDLSKPTIPTRLALDCAHAQEALGWTPEISLEDGIARTLAWYSEHMAPAEGQA
jgi:nucleoside-diphosphate-sugar epimerase